MTSHRKPSFVACEIAGYPKVPTANQMKLASNDLCQQPGTVAMFRCKSLTCEQLERADRENKLIEWACADRSRAIQLVGWCSLIFSKLLHIDVFGCHRADFLEGRPVLNKSKPLSSLNKRLRNLYSCPLLVQLIRLYFFYFTIKLALHNWWEHQYSSHSASSKRFERTLANARVKPELLTEGNDANAHLHRKLVEDSISQQLELERQLVNRAAATLQAMGSPYFMFGFAAETTFVYLLTMVWAAYMHTQLQINLIHPFDVSILRAIIGPRLEQSHKTNAVICDQVNRFLISGENFIRVHLAELANVHDIKKTELTSGDTKISRRASTQVSGAACFKYCHYQQQADKLMAHQTAVGECLLRAALAGRLQPTNRNFFWLRRVAIIYLIACSTTFITGSLLVIIVLIVGPSTSMFSSQYAIRGPRETIFMTELVLYCLIGLVSIIFYLSSLIVACLDQIKCVLDLTHDIKATIRRCELWLDRRRALTELPNDRQPDLSGTETIVRRQMQTMVQLPRTQSVSPTLGGRRRLSGTSRPSIMLSYPQLWVRAAGAQDCNQDELQLNSDVVQLLIRLKMFVKQLQDVQPMLGMIASIAIILMCFLPAMGRIFANYFEPEIKFMIILVSLIFSLFCDFVIAPNCYLHSRCLDLHRNLSYLLAHTVEVLCFQMHEEPACTMDMYDQHTIWILRKELRLPERSLDKFVTRAIKMQLTYASLLRIHFWCGILLISMLIERSSIESSMGNILGESLQFF